MFIGLALLKNGVLAIPTLASAEGFPSPIHFNTHGPMPSRTGIIFGVDPNWKRAHLERAKFTRSYGLNNLVNTGNHWDLMNLRPTSYVMVHHDGTIDNIIANIANNDGLGVVDKSIVFSTHCESDGAVFPSAMVSSLGTKFNIWPTHWMANGVVRGSKDALEAVHRLERLVPINPNGYRYYDVDKLLVVAKQINNLGDIIAEEMVDVAARTLAKPIPEAIEGAKRNRRRDLMHELEDIHLNGLGKRSTEWQEKIEACRINPLPVKNPNNVYY